MKKGKADFHGNVRLMVDSVKMKQTFLIKARTTKSQKKRMKAVESQLKSILRGAEGGGDGVISEQAESASAGATPSSIDNIESMTKQIKEIISNLTRNQQRLVEHQTVRRRKCRLRERPGIARSYTGTEASETTESKI